MLLKRRQVLVGGLQYRFLVRNLFYLIAMALVFVPTILLPLVMTLDDTTMPPEQRDEAARRILALYGYIWVGIPVVLVLCMAHSLLVSHRVAGPLYRFNCIFRSVAAGDLSMSVRIRRGDYLWDEARSMDEMIGSLARKIRAIRERHDEATTTLPLLMEALARGERTDSVVLGGRLTSQLDDLGRQVRQFKLPLAEPGDPRHDLSRVPSAARDSAARVSV